MLKYAAIFTMIVLTLAYPLAVLPFTAIPLFYVARHSIRSIRDGLALRKHFEERDREQAEYDAARKITAYWS